MELVVDTPSKAKKGQKRAAASPDFFWAKTKRLLLRARGAMETCPGATGDASFVMLSDLDAFGDVTALHEVERRLGGKDSLAWKVLLSVTDEDERHDLDQFSRKRKGQKEEMILAEFQSLVVRVQALARQLPQRGDPLIDQVLALPTNDVVEDEDDEAGTGDQEEANTEEKKKKTKKAAKRMKKKTATATPTKKRDRSAGKSKVVEEKKQKQSKKKQTERQIEKQIEKIQSEKKSQKKSLDKEGKGKGELDEVDDDEEVVESGEEVVESVEEEEEVLSLLENDEEKSSNVCQTDVMRLLEEAEKEFDATRVVGSVGVRFGQAQASAALLSSSDIGVVAVDGERWTALLRLHPYRRCS